MVASSRRTPRWSKTTDELVRYVAPLTRPSFQSELASWLEDNSRFRSFVADNKDKIRKKLSASDEQARLDVRAELRVAYLILRERRFQLKFEAYGAGRRGPDLSVTFRENLRFNLEVTRLRATETVDKEARVANVISGKLRQFPIDVPNGLIIATGPVSLGEQSLAEATRLMKSERFNAEPGLQALYPRLSGVFVLDEGTAPAGVVFAPNREARHPLPTEVAVGLATTFASTRSS